MSDRKRILVIDDDPDIREIAQTSLEMVGGHEVATADSGEHGLAAAQADPPDAILLDVMMPGMDGPTTFTRLQSHPDTNQVPVVLLTAKAQEDDRRRFTELGVAGVLVKPFDPVALSGQLGDLLGWER